ncbi:hypothetical protein M6D81_27545 [Paenibacillus sp. J5C_2022]|nr:hypothetical protein [Paenibacillus sp. J5C2022]
MNLMLFVPYVLIQHRYDGTVMSLVIAPVVGTVLLYMYTSAMSRFPGMGMPDIFRERYPRWFSSMIIGGFAIMWWLSSVFVIVAYAILINRFFNPDANTFVILFMLLLACGYAATRSSLTVMFVLEILLLLNAPFILFILVKMLTDTQFNWDAVHVAANYVVNMPNLSALAAATYIFTGYISMSLYNRLMPPNFQYKYRYIYPVFGFAVLLATFFIPIGLHGTEAVGQYVYIWSVTADSLIMQYGFIERLLFLFLIVFLNLTLVFTMTAWHQAMEFVKSCLPGGKPEVDNHRIPVSNYVIIAVFIVFTLAYMFLVNEKENVRYASYWLILRLFVEILLVVWIFVLSRRRMDRT